MTPRDFICTPSSWIADPRLNALSDDAETVFRRLASCTDKNWRFPFDPEAIAHSVRTAAFSPQRRFRAWNPDRIHRGLKELTAAGMLTRHCQGDRHWFEVAAAYRYVKGRDPMGVEDSSPQAQELPLGGPLLAALPSPYPKAAASLPPAGRPACAAEGESAAGCGIGKRTESEQSKANESARQRGSGIGEDSREGSRGRESNPGSFARGETFLPDALWGDLSRFLGFQEMAANGAMWAARRRTSPRALAMAWEDAKDNQQNVRDRARYITARYEAHGGQPVNAQQQEGAA